VYCGEANQQNGIEVAKLLSAAGADVNARTAMGNTPLYLASQKKMKATAEYLIGCGADPLVSAMLLTQVAGWLLAVS